MIKQGINFEPTLTPKETCAYLKISRRTLSTWVKKDLLKPIRINARVLRFRKADLEALSGQQICNPS